MTSGPLLRLWVRDDSLPELERQVRTAQGPIEPAAAAILAGVSAENLEVVRRRPSKPPAFASSRLEIAGEGTSCPHLALPRSTSSIGRGSDTGGYRAHARYSAPMSRENLEIVRAVVDAHNREDFAAVFAAYDRGIQWDVGQVLAPTSDFEPVYYGHEGVRAFWRVWFAAWETAGFEYEEFIDAGDRVIAILSQRMRGRASGIEVEWNSYAQVWTVRGGNIVRVEFFANRREAFEALGLHE